MWSLGAMLCGLLACGGDSKDGTQDAGLPVYAFHVKGAFKDDGLGLPFVAQNGATIHIPADEVRGKQVVCLMSAAGEIPPNAEFLDLVTGTVGDDLTFTLDTMPKFHDGPWEMTVFVLVKGTDFTMGPKMGDIAAYTPLKTKVPEGEPPSTGVTVRVRIDGKDATVKLDNSYFVRF